MHARRGKVPRAPRPLRNSFARKTKNNTCSACYMVACTAWYTVPTYKNIPGIHTPPATNIVGRFRRYACANSHARRQQSRTI